MTPQDSGHVYELVLDDGPDERAPAVRGPVSWRRLLAISLAFVLGLTIGVAATTKQRDAAAARDRAATLSLVAVSETWPDLGSDPDRIKLRFRLLNSGPLPVHVINLQLSFPGFLPGEAQDRRFTIKPREFSTTAAPSGPSDCDDLRRGGDQTASVEVAARVESGDIETVNVPIELMGFTVHEIWTTACEPPYLEGGVWADVSSPARIVHTADGPVVAATLQLGHEVEPPELTSAAGNEFFDLQPATSASSLPPVEGFGAEQRATTVEFVLRTCPAPERLADATTTGFRVVVATADSQQELELGVWDPALLVELIELVHLQCDEPAG